MLTFVYYIGTFYRVDSVGEGKTTESAKGLCTRGVHDVNKIEGSLLKIGHLFKFNKYLFMEKFAKQIITDLKNTDPDACKYQISLYL